MTAVLKLEITSFAVVILPCRKFQEAYGFNVLALNDA